MQLLALIDRRLLPDDPGLHALQLLHEVRHVDDEVADHREVSKRLDDDRSGVEVAQERRAGEPWLAVHHHPAGSAHAHPARPSVREAAVEVVLDVVQGVQYHHVVGSRDVELVEVRLWGALGPVAADLQRDRVCTHTLPPEILNICARRAATA
jgi:hypothetical protein